MKKALSILLVFLMIGLVAVSGCTDTSDEEEDGEEETDEEGTEEEDNTIEEL
ncbi:MAG: hypothetical protein AWU59_1615 [Methanolobus sp. T82-4]|jgi:ABC-type Fe3+-citrate transport system substrate-binding protein|nr:MAG: hypothetical protein AWU59_1615 [Methanolobus sp. T82-4]